jgi:hypothetical protein
MIAYGFQRKGAGGGYGELYLQIFKAHTFTPAATLYQDTVIRKI